MILMHDHVCSFMKSIFKNEAMNHRMRLDLMLIAFFLLQLSLTQAQNAKPVKLKTEYLENPIGIDAHQPRLSWQLDDTRKGAKQTAYRVLVSRDSLVLTRGEADTWNSEWKTSDTPIVSYGGDALWPFTRYFWKTEVKDHEGQVSSSAIAFFETGMMDQLNWKGAWISDVNDVNLKPAPYFRKEFTTSKKIRSARAYIAVGGLYELYINGEKIGNHRLDPTYTRFDRRTLYVTYDITKNLQDGKNALGVLLGNGWYNHQSTAVWYFHKAPWRARPAFCMDVRLIYDDGSVETITTDKSWKTSLSPVIFNSIYTAEHYDARLEQPGWSTTNFDAKAWKDVIYRAAPSPNITAQVLHPIRNVEEVKVKKMVKLNDTTYVFDLGRNISGVSKIKVKGEAGTVIRLKHGERLYPNGHVDISNIDVHYRPTDNTDPFQTDIFILNGKNEEVFMPRFNYKGFQFVEVTSRGALTQESLTGYFMHSDVPVAGKISSSDAMLNGIWFATNNSYLSNLFGYPTDCPQREKNGWTGDAAIAIETGLYNFDGITIYEKWLADHRDEQQPNGVLPAIIPTGGWGYEWANGPDWTSTIAIIPWNVYLFYGDNKILGDNYDNIKRYVDYIDEHYPSGTTTWGLGDWVPVKSKASVELTSTCYYYTDVSILARAAKMFGKEEDHRKYAALAAKIKDEFNRKFLDRAKGIYASGLQTELSVPLFWGLVPDDMKTNVAGNLAKRVEADGFHLDVGLLGTKAILNALVDNGYPDVAYKLAMQDTYPSWGWWIKNGATTLYENWNINSKNDISLNHIMFGEVGAWMYKSLAGIRPDPSQPGFKNVIFQPYFANGLTEFSAFHEGPYGTIHSSWKRNGKRITWNVTVPPGSSATVNLPEVKGLKPYLEKKQLTEQTITLEAGAYVFELR
jgi:alpha-L-rhamnosidase